MSFALASMMIPISAVALPVDVFFEGIRPSGEPETAFGIGLTSALNARDNFGIQIIDGSNAMGSSIVGQLAVTQSDPTGFDPSPGTAPFNVASSDWGFQNVSGAAITGQNYVAFTHTDPFVLQGVPVDYTDENVGITIDADDGWSIIMVTSGGNDFYYPALLLDQAVPNPFDGNLAAGAIVNAEINYAVNQALIEVGAGTNVFALPEYEIRFVNIPVPEPGTALLFGMGLIGLASVRRKD